MVQVDVVEVQGERAHASECGASRAAATLRAMRLRTFTAVLVALALCLLAVAGAAAEDDLSGSVHDQTKKWYPHMHDAAEWARHRTGHIAFAVETEHRRWGYHETRVYPSASLLKPILLVAYLQRSSVRDRPLSHDDRALIAPMIQRSDNDAATRVLDIVGMDALRSVGRQAGMKHFVPHNHPWGYSEITAEDQAHFFLHIDRLIPQRHRAYAMHLLATIVPSQRWGIGRVIPSGWDAYFKGGWGSGTGWVDHQTVLLVRGDHRAAISILTYLDGSHPYGKQTLQGLFMRLLHGFGGDVLPAGSD